MNLSMAEAFKVRGSNDTIYWEAEPATRGTFTLLSTCIVTLSLCVWNCIHLNLPEDGKYWPKLLRRLGWIFSALIIPECLIMIAWIQRQTAKRISKEVMEAFNSEKKPMADPENQRLSRQHPWTMTHSFWAIMGGIAIHPGDSDPFIPESQRSTLTPNGVSLLLQFEPQSLPDISEEEVKDKSKGSSFSKFVACVQATWFCLSCIARLSQKLPVSLLELNTFAHAFCTVIVYILWWRKPIDIEQPLVIQEDRLRRLLAYMWMASKTSCIPKPARRSDATVTVGRDPEFEAIIDGKASCAGGVADSAVSSATPTALELISSGVDIPSTCAPSITGPSTVQVTTTQDLPNTGFIVNGKSTRWVVSTTYNGGEHSDPHTYVRHNPAIFNLTPCDVQRWRLAREAMDKYHLKKPDTNLDLVTVRIVPESTSLTGPDEKPTTWAYLGFSLVAAGYGGLHAIAWNSHFPTHRELKLWRISAIVIASPAALCSLLILLVLIIVFLIITFKFCYRKLVPDVNRKPVKESPPNLATVKEEEADGGIGSIIGYIIYLFFPYFVILYFLGRVYLVYESFRTVFFLPPEAYIATSWPQYFPHIT